MITCTNGLRFKGIPERRIGSSRSSSGSTPLVSLSRDVLDQLLEQGYFVLG